MRIGTDTSFWAENVDYTKMVANGAEFTILRAGQGSWIDNYFQKNYDASEGMLPRSTYWFFDQRYKPSRQAELLAAVLKDNPLEGYIWADYERDYDNAPYASWVDFHTFLREIERLIPEMVGRIGVYTRYYYWNEKVPQDKWNLFEKYPFWEARYEADAPFDKPFKSLLWQFSERGDGVAYGLNKYVKTAIDLNYFMGTDEEWEIFTGNIENNVLEVAEEVEPEILATVVSGKVPSLKDGSGIDYETVARTWGGRQFPVKNVKHPDDDGFIYCETTLHVPVENIFTGKKYVTLETVVDEEPPDNPARRWNWKPDPNRPENLYSCYQDKWKYVNVREERGSGKILATTYRGAVIVGDRIVTDRGQKWLHTLYVENPNIPIEGWISIDDADLLVWEVPEKTLNSLIPPKSSIPAEIKRFVTAPDDGKYWWWGFETDKRYSKLSVPYTAVFVKPNQQRVVFVQLQEPTQFFQFELSMLDNPGMPIAYYVMVYSSLMAQNRALTDYTSSEDKNFTTDYVIGANLELNNPYYFKLLGFKGNMYYEESRDSDTEIRFGGLDQDNLPYPEDVHGNPRYVQMFTVVKPEKHPDNRFMVSTNAPQISRMIDGRMENIGSSIINLAKPWTSNVLITELEEVNVGEKKHLVNLSRDVNIF